MNKSYNSKLRLVGTLLFFTGITAGVVFKFNHYYEFAFSGLFLLLLTVRSKYQPRMQIYAYLFLVYIFAGLAGDLLLGIKLTGLWHYSYHYQYEYILLYGLLYPIAGLLMVQTYLIVKSILVPKTKKAQSTIRTLVYRRIAAALAATSIVLLLLSRVDKNYIPSYMLFVAISFSAFFWIEDYTNKIGGRTFSSDFAGSPMRVGLAAIAATYIQFVLQELTNVRANQWIYRLPNANASLGGSVHWLVLIGWPLLLILPLAVYYSVNNRNLFYRLFSKIVKI